MLKHLAILGMLLATVQAPPPTPGQASNNPADGSGNVQKQPKNGNPDAKPSPSPLPQDSARPAQPDAQKPSAKDASNSVTIRELPTVSVGKDWADWAYWVFNGLLVVVGAFQVGLLYMTWKSVERQAKLLAFIQRPYVSLQDWRMASRIESGKESNVCYFSIVNPNSYAIILTRVDVDVKPMVYPGSAVETPGIQKSYENAIMHDTLPPGGRVPIQVPLHIRKEDREDFSAAKYLVSFAVSAWMRNADGGEVPQHFLQIAVVGPDKIFPWAMTLSPMEKRTQSECNPQNPN